MKTPRDILLEHHRAAAPKLDAIRRNVLNAGQQQPPRNSWSLGEFLWSLRWHLAGMSAIWAATIVLNLNAANTSRATATALPAKQAPPQVVLASLRENRRQIAELIGPSPADADQRKNFPSGPRSERRKNTALA